MAYPVSDSDVIGKLSGIIDTAELAERPLSQFYKPSKSLISFREKLK
jgi:hypothetical protein